MGNDSGYQVNHGVGPSPAYVSYAGTLWTCIESSLLMDADTPSVYTVSYQRASQGPGPSQARPSNGQSHGSLMSVALVRSA